MHVVLHVSQQAVLQIFNCIFLIGEKFKVSFIFSNLEPLFFAVIQKVNLSMGYLSYGFVYRLPEIIPMGHE